ncbi:hypothetical protein [Roseiconus lacunae]|uniref:Secreted protein n=1 Tax=Roseiconus lacunae TaxID=2605694 RepID=A0ABT7PNA5_9BACT|nr:hypothetical protein [Roseiconus lacunae]MCD0460652.1 hypothetical protein [Roseiconus lacunae]MDM4017813.1 hypothetical protein [Roseiconus lacunae]WRQ48444.1 hypothetical protein U8335_15870 [Stieleria sp. HD01]
MKRFFCLSVLFVSAALVAGCGNQPEATSTGVDDSVVHTEEQMESMAEQNASDMQSQ